MRFSNIIRLIILATFLWVLFGCSTTSEFDEAFASRVVVQPRIADADGGAIYRANGGRFLFEDLKAARTGDILTVRLVEQTNASKSSGTSTSKTTDASLTSPTVLGLPITRRGVPLFDGSIGGDQSFDGAGSSNQSNSLIGDITVTIVERYSNGNLLIRGEKWVTLNQGREFIRLSGIVRSYDIEPDNSVISTKIANAQITYSSKGSLAAANRMGLFSRFFQSIISGF